MARYRTKKQVFATVSALVAYSELVNRANDEVEITSLSKSFKWTAGSTQAHDGNSVIEQTSESANGRWIAPTATILQNTGSFSVPSFDNGQKELLTATVLGLPVGTPIHISATNADVAYGGAVIPDGIVLRYSNSVKVADKIECEVVNETNTDDTLAFTLNVVVKKL
jgi:hypothetical protein